MENKIKREDVVNNLLWGLWRSIDEGYKMQYPRDIWDHFENAIRSASYTDSLKVFLSNFKKRIPLTLQAQFSQDIVGIIDSNEDYDILNWLRTEASYLVIQVRILNTDRKNNIKL